MDRRRLRGSTHAASTTPGRWPLLLAVALCLLARSSPLDAGVDRDGYADLVIGAPGETVVGHADAGSLDLLYGSAGGLDAGRGDYLTQIHGLPDDPDADDRFALAPAIGDFDGDGHGDLAVGVPFDDVDNVADAGAVNVLFGTPLGIDTAGGQFWYQGAGSATGLRETGDRYGRSLAAYPRAVTASFEPDHVVFIPLTLRSTP